MAPVLSVIKGDNDVLIAEVAKLWIKPDDMVMDLTYGGGLFWKIFRPENLVTNDLYVPGADFKEDYRLLPPGWANSFDVVVFDPPYITTGGKNKPAMDDFYARFGLGHLKGWQRLFKDLEYGIASAARIAKPGGRVFVKCMDYVESGHIRWGRRHVVEVAEAVKLDHVDEFIHASGTGAQPKKNLDGSPRRQVHSRRAHSFLCIFEKKR